MHPECPDYDLCQNCEALPIAVHPPNHPVLKMRSPETIIPTVYRVGQRSLIDNNNHNGQLNADHRDGQEISTGASFNTPIIHVPRVWTPIDRVATPTPASAQKEYALERSDAESPSARQPEDSATDQMFSNPFADFFASLSSAPTAFKVDTQTVNPWPTTNTAERDELYQVMTDLAGSNTSERDPNNIAFGSKLVEKQPAKNMLERSSLLDCLSLVQASSQTSPPISSRGIATDANGPVVPPVVGSSPTDPQDIQATPGLQPVPDETRESVSNEGFVKTASAANETATESLRQRDDLSSNETGTSPGIPSLELLSVHKSLADLVRELPTLVPPVSVTKEAVEISPARVPLSAAFVEDVTVPDGQVFPPGAEFVKCWTLLNDSGREWPESTELIFLAGDSLSIPATADSGSTSTDLAVHVGKTAPGQTVDVWTGELKAPETPGRYVGYWRLRANGELFGNSLWIELVFFHLLYFHATLTLNAGSMSLKQTREALQMSRWLPRRS